MHVPPHFQESRDAVLSALLEQAGLITLVTVDDDGAFEASPLPMLVESDENGRPVRLLGHVARANPLAALSSRRALAVAMGPDAYVSPSLYPSKAESGRVVPTWNYVALHLHGTINIFTEAAALQNLLQRLTARHEASREAPWSLDDAPPDYIAAQLRAIVGVSFAIERIEAKAKMSQNRTPRDRSGVFDGLSETPATRQVADMMRLLGAG